MSPAGESGPLPSTSQPSSPLSSMIGQIQRSLLDVHEDFVCIIDSQGLVVYANRSLRNFFDRMKDAVAQPLVGKCWTSVLRRVDTPQLLIEGIREALRGRGRPRQFSFTIEKKEHVGKLRIHPLRRSAEARGFACIFRDESAVTRLQQRLTQEEFVDTETGLYNRKTMEIMFQLELDKSNRDSGRSHLGVMMLQLSNLDQFRAAIEPSMMSEVMSHLSNCISTAVRPHDLVFRYDDNRILILMLQFEWKSDLLLVAHRIQDSIAIPFHAGSTVIHLASVAGISVFPEDGTEAPVLMSHAISALNQAAEQEESALMFNRKDHELALERLFIRSGLSRAVLQKELLLYYMPIVDAQGTLAGVEALVRWDHPQRGLLGPDAFVPIAIHSRVIGAISRWVINRVQDDYAEFFQRHQLFVTCNLSALDFADKYFPEALDSLVEKRIPPEHLKIEITESEVMANRDQALTLIASMHKRGIEVLIDDFGVGQSSLAYLRDLPAQYIKIDHSFITHIEGEGPDAEFVRQIIKLSLTRGVGVIIEGIEKENHFRLFSSSGARYFQGYHFGKPSPALELLKRYFPEM